jgi:hypothetical protein
VLSAAHAAAFVVCAALGQILFQVLLRPAGRAGSDGGRVEFEPFLLIYQRAALVRLALLEGAALFGLVVCFLVAGSGQLRTDPLLALNALSALYLLLVAGASFPTEDRLRAKWRELTSGSSWRRPA